MHDTATLILAIVGALILWTTSVISLVAWLLGKFRSVETKVYIEAEKSRRDNTNKFEELITRVYRLELKAFGFTFAEGVPRTDESKSEE